jgi:hypothetical protein
MHMGINNLPMRAGEVEPSKTVGVYGTNITHSRFLGIFQEALRGLDWHSLHLDASFDRVNGFYDNGINAILVCADLPAKKPVLRNPAPGILEFASRREISRGVIVPATNPEFEHSIKGLYDKIFRVDTNRNIKGLVKDISPVIAWLNGIVFD